MYVVSRRRRPKIYRKPVNTVEQEEELPCKYEVDWFRFNMLFFFN